MLDNRVLANRNDDRPTESMSRERCKGAGREVLRTLVACGMVTIAIGCSSLGVDTRYGEPIQVSVISDAAIDESSGLEPAFGRDEVFWTHNDDRDDNRLFAFESGGQRFGVYRIADVLPEDWEDLSTFRVDGVTYILCADVGDNRGTREQLAIYFVEEPPTCAKDGIVAVTGRVVFSYEDGRHDCEAVAVDSSRKSILLASKTGDPELSTLYELPLALTSSNKLSARRLGRLGIANITSMDISRDGLRAAFLAYEEVWELRRNQRESWAEVLAIKTRLRKIAHLPRGQWEGICFGEDDETLYVTNEKIPTRLFVICPL